MNEYEIVAAAHENRSGVAGNAAAYLYGFMLSVNSHSDGWAYWKAASRAARMLSLFVQSKSSDQAAFRKAVGPIKSLCTRHNIPAPGNKDS
jgi:hypothetical protein